MADWIQIAKGCSRTNPPIVIEPPQSVHRKWDEYLSQRFVKTSRAGSQGEKVNLSEFHWFNFGVAQIQEPGEPVKLAHHPGEVWMRRTLDPTAPWTILDLRRNAPRDKSKWGTGIRTRDLPPLAAPVVPITDPKFALYSGPLPITKAKIDDLHTLSKFLKDPAKAALYPAYMPGQRVKNPEPGEEPAEDAEEPDGQAYAAGETGAGELSSEGESTSEESGSSSDEEEESLAARGKRIRVSA